MATYGSFPGVEVTTEQGGIQSVSIGLEENVIIFGEAKYDSNGDVDGDASAGDLVSIAAPSETDTFFGEGSEVGDAMNEAISNGANIDFLRGMAVPQNNVTGETAGSQTGELANVEIKENTDEITWTDDDADSTEFTVEFRYEGAPVTPSDADTVYINPLTGQYAASSGPSSSEFTVDYAHMDYESAFNEDAVSNYINENETGVLFGMSDSDIVSTKLNTVVSSMRDNYQLVTGFCFAEPNGSQELDTVTPENGGAEPRYNTSVYSENYSGFTDADDPGANQSVLSNAFFKPAPARVGGEHGKTIGGGLAGRYVGNPLDDAVYNEAISGYSRLQQSLNKTEAGDLRSEDLIPVRSEGSIRVKGNRATNFSESDSVAADFWTRRITDRVILVVKQIGDAILGRINNPTTRGEAEDSITRQLGSLAQQGIIKPNGDEENFAVQVYESSTNKNQVNIDVQFTPYGIVKNVDTTVTVNV